MKIIFKSSKKKNAIILSLILGLFFLNSKKAFATQTPQTPQTTPQQTAQNQQQDETPKVLQVGSADKTIINVQLRLIDLNYFSFKHTGTFGSMTRASVVDFQEKNGLLSDGSIGTETLTKIFSNEAVRKPEVSMPNIGVMSANAPAVFGALEEWGVVNAKFPLGVSTKVTDLNTAKTYNVKRVGGKNHAKIELSNAQDEATFIECFGGAKNWSKRPVLVSIDGKQIAASISGDLQNTTTIYFKNSSSDSANLVDKEHRKNILRASGSLPW